MQFLYPNVLFLLALLGVLMFLIATNKDNLQRFFDKDILDKLTVHSKSIGNTTRNILLFMILILFILSLARPVINMKEQKVKQQFIPLVIALDVSKSMRATDIYPSRLSLAKKKLKLIIQNSPNAIIGVLLFAKNSYILSPVTEDFTSLNYIVDNLDTSLTVANGSNIFAVLEATREMLKDYNVKNLIILSDGGNDNEYIKELDFAKENKMEIYTIGLATKKGAPIPEEKGYLTNKNGDIVTVSLNESIKQFALNSGGGYIDFSLSSHDVDAILTQIQKQSKREEVDSKKIKTYTELFYYPLAFGIFCLLIALSSFPSFRKNVVAIMLITLYFYPQNQYASMLDFKTLESAKQEYNNKNYKNAISDYSKVKVSNESNYNLANSYYKNGEFKKAIQTYDKIVTSDKNLEYKKLHNLGNSYVKEKNLEKAKEFYEKALKLNDDKQTEQNLEAVKKALEKQKKKQDKKDKNEDENKKQDKDKKNKDNKKEQDKNKKQDKNKDGKEEKKKQDKNDNKKQEDKKQEKKDKDKKQEKNKEEKKDGKNQTKVKQTKPSQKQLSDMEEKKWMKSLQNKKTPIMLQQFKSKKSQTNSGEQPW